MNLGERIKYLRNELNLKQVDFGQKINLTKFAISNYENERTGIPDRVINDVCRVFNVSEQWLRTGNGEMFIPEDMTYQYNVGRLGSEKNEFKKFYLNTMMNLPDEYWDYIYNEFKKFDKKNKE